MSDTRPQAVQNLLDWIDAELGRNYRKFVGGNMTKFEFEKANNELLRLSDTVQEQSQSLAGRQ